VDLVKLLSGRKGATRARKRVELDARPWFPLDVEPGKDPPSEFCMFRAGENPSEKGTFVFDAASCASVMAKYALRKVPMMMDYEHMSLAEPPIVAPASAKQFVPEVRNGELWATKVVWTPTADGYLRNGEYRMFSPAVIYTENDDGTLHIESLINCALTNNPALHGIDPLVAAATAKPDKDGDKDMDEDELKALKAENEKLRKALSGMEEKCTALSTQLSALTSKKDKDEEEEMKALRLISAEVATVTGKADPREMVGVLRAVKLKADAGDVAIAKLAETEQKGRDDEFTSLLTAAIEKDMKIPPGQKTFWLSTCQKDGKTTVEGLAMLKSFLPGQTAVVTPSGAGHGSRKTESGQRAVGLSGFGDQELTSEQKKAALTLIGPAKMKAFMKFRANGESFDEEDDAAAAASAVA
jgi:phage I-like protein